MNQKGICFANRDNPSTIYQAHTLASDTLIEEFGPILYTKGQLMLRPYRIKKNYAEWGRERII